MNSDQEKRWQYRLEERRLRESIGRQVREARQEKGLTVEELAAQVGLAVQTVYRMEVGVVGTTITRLRDFCRVLDLDLSELLGEADRDSNEIRVALRGKHLTLKQREAILRIIREATNDNKENN